MIFPKTGWTLGAYALILNRAGEVLLIHRRDEDIWQSPGGGVEETERPTEAVIREVEEETGFEITVNRLTAVYFATTRKDVVITFLCSIIGGAATPSDETDRVCFFSVDALPDMTPATRKRILDYLESPTSISWTEELE